MMSSQGLSLIFVLLCISFSRRSFCVCDEIIWRRVGWEILPEEAALLVAKPSPSHCLPYPLNRVCYDFANSDAFQDLLRLLHILVQALSFLLSFLSLLGLWMKWKKRKKKVAHQALLGTSGDDLRSLSLYEIQQTLHELFATTLMLTKRYQNPASHRHLAKKVKYRPLRKKKIRE